MSNYIRLIQKVESFFKQEKFKKRAKTIFFRTVGDVEYYFFVDSLQSGFRATCTIGVYFKKFNTCFSNVLNKRDFQRTIYLRTEVSQIESRFTRFVLESESDIETTSQLTKEFYDKYALKFFDDNSTLLGVLESLKLVEVIPNSTSGTDHSVPRDTAMLLSLFLTKLLEEEEYKDRINHYLNLLEEAKENNIREHGQPGAFAMYIQTVEDAVSKINAANWPEIRKKLEVG